MSEKKAKQKNQTLGEFLKETRKNSDLSLEDARESTKITLAVLTAIEGDDFSAMPAEAFCRGFYVMYAKFLNLDHERILERYLEVRGLPPVTSTVQSTPPVRKSGQFRNYAEPSPVSPLMSSFFALFILVAVIIGTCWYFNWNPIDYLNSKLDAIQTGSQQTEISNTAPVPTTEVLSVSETEAETSVQPVENTAIKTDREQPELITAPAPYHLEINFRSEGALSTTLDKGVPVDNQFQSGQTLQWEVKESILLDMPEEIEASIRMNDIEIPLPEAENGHRVLSLPEDLLN